MDFTVAICTYNGQNRIPEVLDALLDQKGTEQIKWEVIVIDNNSTDKTADVISEYISRWRSDATLRYVFEELQGLSYARIRAITESHSRELVGFLDDDNIPGQNWVAEAYSFGVNQPQIGAYGGNINVKLDDNPPPYFKKIKLYLTVYNRGNTAFCYHRSDKARSVPAGAGCVFRKQAWKQVIPDDPRKLLLVGRDLKHKILIGGEDAEMLYYIQNTDWEIWHNPKMEIWHHIEKRRMEPDYLLNLARSYGLCQHRVRMARYYPWQWKFLTLFTPALMLREGVNLCKFYLKNKQKIQSDFGTACKFEEKLGQFYSPVLSWYLKFKYK